MLGGGGGVSGGAGLRSLDRASAPGHGESRGWLESLDEFWQFGRQLRPELAAV